MSQANFQNNSTNVRSNFTANRQDLPFKTTNR